MQFRRLMTLGAVSLCTLATTVTTGFAASSPLGVWVDHTGRGAVEITDCNGKLCGRLVWFKDTRHEKDGCNFQIIGNVRSMGGNKWDGGWIVDPDKNPNKKYDVEITVLSEQKLRVMGYAGMKFLSETMTWTRAPADLKKCSEDVAAPAPADPSDPAAGSGKEGGERKAEAPAEKPKVAEPEEPREPAAKPTQTARKKGKDCKVSYAGYTIAVPCGVLE